MTLPNATARRLFLHRHGLTGAPTGAAKAAALAQVIYDLGFVQVDSVNTFARAHDMILWSRRQTYRPDNLQRLHARDRAVFEHWTHDASVIPMAFWPHWQHRCARDSERLRVRWTNWQGADFIHKCDDVLNRIARHGAVTSSDFAGERAAKSTGWWDWHPSKAALEYLWRTGQIAVARRDGFRKVYDLTERVIPDEHRGEAEEEASIDWAARAALERLGFGTAAEIGGFFALITPDQAKAWCRDALSRGDIQQVLIEGTDGRTKPAFVLPGTLDQTPPDPTDRVRILSPFDPALRDRDRVESLFGFYYRIEIFVPEARRQYGYYVFPVMEGDRLIGRIDMKAQRDTDTLAVRAFWPEAGVPMGKGRMARLMAELDRAATYADATRLDFADGWLRG